MVQCQERRVYMQPGMKELQMEKLTIEEFRVCRFLGMYIRIGKIHRQEWFYDTPGLRTVTRDYYFDEEHRYRYDSYGNVTETHAMSITTGAPRGTRYRYGYLYDSLGNITTRFNYTLQDTQYYTYTFYPDSSVVEIKGYSPYPSHYVYDTSGRCIYAIDYTRNGTPLVTRYGSYADDDEYALLERDSLGFIVKSVYYRNYGYGNYGHAPGYYMCRYKRHLRPWTDCLQSGDLLFVSDTSGMGQAVKETTGRYTHVAMVERSGDSLFVIDATQKRGVARRPFNKTFASKMPVDVYRLAIPFDTAAVIARAHALIGRPYDNAFLPDNDAYYCSELIQAAFGTFFKSQPMNWRDADGNLPPYWVEHFKKMNMPIPEGVEGTNPTDLAHSPLLKKL